MDTTKLTNIIRDEHFMRLAAVLSAAQPANWRHNHACIPSVRETIDELLGLVKNLSKDGSEPIRKDFLRRFTALLVSITREDPSLTYTGDDVAWILECLERDGDEQAMIFSLLFAYASAPMRWYSAEQIAQITGKSASFWQKLAAEERIIGVRKLGKTWLFPEHGLRAYGVALPAESAESAESAENGEESEE